MDEGHSTDPAETYVRVLREFGVGDAEVVKLHRGDPGNVDPVSQVRTRHAGTDPGELFAELGRALVRSSRGVAVPVGTGLVESAGDLADPLSTFGYDLAVSDDGATFEVSVTDAVSGLADEGSFQFPTGALGTDNVPALAAAIEELLGGDDLRFVLLTPGPGRWRFVLLGSGSLAAVRSTYGERVQVLGQPLLAAHQPREFVDGAPTNTAYVARGEEDPPTDPEEDISAAPGTPAWIRAAAAREGGVDELLEALTESGPRTYVSERTADDVLAEVPEFSGDGATETRTAGIDDVLERIREGKRAGAGPSTAVSDRPLDVFDDGESETTDDPPEGEERTTETGSGDGRGTPEDGGDEEGEVAHEEDLGEDARDAGSGDDSLVGGGPDEVVVEGSVDDILAERRARDQDRDRPADDSSPDDTEEPAWEPIPEADAESETAAENRADHATGSRTSVDAFAGGESGTDSSGGDPDDDRTGVDELIDDAESDRIAPEEWEPVAPASDDETPIRDAEADDADPTEGRFDGALRRSDAVTGDDDPGEREGDDDEEGVVDRIRNIWDRMTSE
jgi:hypothetical protein